MQLEKMKKDPGENGKIISLAAVSYQRNKPADKQQPLSRRMASAPLRSPNIPRYLSGGLLKQETNREGKS